ncbi:hypothetical protein ACTFIU_005865 [Dictyostelium citrinum]
MHHHHICISYCFDLHGHCYRMFNPIEILGSNASSSNSIRRGYRSIVNGSSNVLFYQLQELEMIIKNLKSPDSSFWNVDLTSHKPSNIPFRRIINNKCFLTNHSLYSIGALKIMNQH